MNELSGYFVSPGMSNCVTARVAMLFLASPLDGDCVGSVVMVMYIRVGGGGYCVVSVCVGGTYPLYFLEAF